MTRQMAARITPQPSLEVDPGRSGRTRAIQNSLFGTGLPAAGALQRRPCRRRGAGPHGSPIGNLERQRALLAILSPARATHITRRRDTRKKRRCYALVRVDAWAFDAAALGPNGWRDQSESMWAGRTSKGPSRAKRRFSAPPQRALHTSGHSTHGCAKMPRGWSGRHEGANAADHSDSRDAFGPIGNLGCPLCMQPSACRARRWKGTPSLRRVARMSRRLIPRCPQRGAQIPTGRPGRGSPVGSGPDLLLRAVLPPAPRQPVPPPVLAAA